MSYTDTKKLKGVEKMKLPIKDKYFKLIKEGKKKLEFRDAHITFINETTKEQLQLNIKDVKIFDRVEVFRFYPELQKTNMFDNSKILVFSLDVVK